MFDQGYRLSRAFVHPQLRSVRLQLHQGLMARQGQVMRAQALAESLDQRTQTLAGTVSARSAELAEALNNGTALLYYTGLTRVAKSILQDIVRGMFLNRAGTLEILDDISAHARESFDLLHRQSWDDLCRVVRRSWELNCALDSGTNPPEVREILARVADWTAAAKLPGAGGGGYVFFLAKDVEASARLRRELTDRPPNPRARFVKMKISPTGFQVTRS
jgi:galactokinase/mevalonate kinase-like predicted kinase